MYTPKRLYIGQPGTVEQTLYTVPSLKNVILKQIVLTNTTATDAVISLSMVPSGSTPGNNNRILKDLSILANNFKIIELAQVLGTGDSISAIQTTDGAITAAISGVEFE